MNDYAQNNYNIYNKRKHNNKKEYLSTHNVNDNDNSNDNKNDNNTDNKNDDNNDDDSDKK